MNTPLKPQDLDLLSAYLDDRLSARERAHLEARLSREANLQRQLQELRSTTLALRALPKLTPPRRYTLTPQMVGNLRRPAAPAYPLLQLSTALATLVFGVVLGVDLLGRFGAAAPTAAPAPLEQAVASTTVVEGPTAEAGHEVAQAPATLPADAAVKGEPDVSPTPPAPPTLGTPTPMMEARALTAPATETPTEATAEVEAPSIAAAVEATATLAPEPTAAPEAGAADEGQAESPPPSAPSLRQLEIVLGLLALALAAATVWVRRAGLA